MCLNKVQVSWTQLPFLLLVVIMYFGLSWIYYTFTGHSLYATTSEPNVYSALIMRYALVLGIFVVVFVVIYGLHKVRTSLGKNLEESDVQTEVIIVEDFPTEPKPASLSNRSVFPPASQAQAFSHILTFF
ncbi:hypothetical protein K493DRAFT_308869 [Basidiobolus meristosporus CBS 931.73]|uniref:Uncharacterized protein n=1 Tax=Basidiobolus meristosporus CBS 931.73 TaxID=1314790 RepID=A0A1Y1WWJ8_9FUNG|nr:hypothetical protein K493DRAFT_308869 [Basidiobolus meristosporus CBS 931.73]|eukprot:ORX77576.1 hypothetical protein K493DRAFT_308869 [Basidiobolus meristosporus CBS 931.73]